MAKSTKAPRATPARVIEYPHPCDLDDTPPRVARLAVADLEGASGTYGQHVIATVQQVRSGYMTELLTAEPSLTPEQLASRWDASDEALACVRLMRASRAVSTATKQVRTLLGPIR